MRLGFLLFLFRKIITLMLFKFQIKFIDDILDYRFPINPQNPHNGKIKVVLFKIVKCTTKKS